jgi:hypothetical protein
MNALQQQITDLEQRNAELRRELSERDDDELEAARGRQPRADHIAQPDDSQSLNASSLRERSPVLALYARRCSSCYASRRTRRTVPRARARTV